MGDDLPVLPRLAAFSERRDRFLIVCYDADGAALSKAEIIEAPTADAAVVIGQTAVADHAMVFVMLETQDARGVIRSSVLRVFEQA